MYELVSPYQFGFVPTMSQMIRTLPLAYILLNTWLREKATLRCRAPPLMPCSTFRGLKLGLDDWIIWPRCINVLAHINMALHQHISNDWITATCVYLADYMTVKKGHSSPQSSALHAVLDIPRARWKMLLGSETMWARNRWGISTCLGFWRGWRFYTNIYVNIAVIWA